jgi:hypothetical protein
VTAPSSPDYVLQKQKVKDWCSCVIDTFLGRFLPRGTSAGRDPFGPGD